MHIENAVRILKNVVADAVNKEAFETVLSELEKEDKKIDHLEKLNKFQSKDIKKAVDYTFELNEELEKKENIIDLMSKYIYKREDNTINIGKIYCPLQDCDDINRDVNCDVCIKQYFTKKVEDK